MAASATPGVGHVVRTYLPRTQTFVHTQLRCTPRYRAAVFAQRVENAAEFPFDPVVQVAGGPLSQRLAGRARAARGRWPTSFHAQLARGVREHACAALHAHFGPSGSMALPVVERLELPLITTFYGFDLAPAEAEGYGPLFATGSLFLVEGPHMGRTLSSLGCPGDRIGLQRIGFPVDRFPLVERPRGEELVVIVTGRMVPKKGFDLAVRAFAAARPQLGPSRLVLVGDGPERARVEQLADELRVAEHVDFAGMLAYGEYQELMHRADVGLQPSRTAPDGDTEGGAPTALLEMQATGLPVVSTRHADIPFVVADDAALADEEDVDGLTRALVRAGRLEDDERRTLAAAGRRFVEEHHAGARVGATLADHYDTVLGVNDR